MAKAVEVCNSAMKRTGCRGPSERGGGASCPPVLFAPKRAQPCPAERAPTKRAGFNTGAPCVWLPLRKLIAGLIIHQLLLQGCILLPVRTQVAHCDRHTKHLYTSCPSSDMGDEPECRRRRTVHARQGAGGGALYMQGR
eukprot:125605-Chlamydomonas_euryale.AAC.1